MHINVAKLEAVLKGLNLEIKWGVKQATIVTHYQFLTGLIPISQKAIAPKSADF